MKRFFLVQSLILFFQLIFVTPQYAKNSVKFNEYRVENGKGIASYSIYSETTKSCNLSFLALPTEYTDNSFSVYTVRINNIESTSKITFSQSGWQVANTINMELTLNKGNNTISFVSNGKDIPQIKNIEILKHNRQLAPYVSLNKQTIKNMIPVSSTMKTTRANTPDLPESLFRSGVSINQPYSYTFSLPIYYEAGDRASFYGPTANDPSYGMYESTVEYNVYLFNENPELFSESSTSNNKYLFWQIDSIPYTGLYYLLVEAKNEGDCGMVTLLINNNMLYKHSYVSNRTFTVLKENSALGVYVSAKDSSYNMFTINGRSGEEYHNADPCLWLKKYNNNYGKNVIVAYNDNNSVPSSFSWGNNARIRAKLLSSPMHSTPLYNVLLSSSYPSYSTSDTCDLYYSYWNTPDMKFFKKSDFPNLKEEDAIESGTIPAYNCIAWSVGDDQTWLWVDDDKNVGWFDRLYNNEIVQNGFNKYVRTAGSLKYTRIGATEQNSVVDLWGKIVNGDTIVTHASIKNDYDGIPHGYDWESKCGSNSRIFHPRYALSGGIYGNVIAHYRIADNQNINKTFPQIMRAEAIADGELIIENISVTPEEEKILTEEINGIQIENRNEFDLLYDKWQIYTDSLRYESNIWNFRKCNEYTNLLMYLNLHPKVVFSLYEKFIHGDFFAAILIKDISLKPGSDTEITWNNIMNAPLLNNTIRTQRSSITLFIKSVLNKTAEMPEVEGVMHSNDDKFDVIVSQSQLVVDVYVVKSSRYSIHVMNLETNNIYQLSPDKNIEPGRYTHKCNIEPGLYVVTYILNGNINSKKIIVH